MLHERCYGVDSILASYWDNLGFKQINKIVSVCITKYGFVSLRKLLMSFMRGVVLVFVYSDKELVSGAAGAPCNYGSRRSIVGCLPPQWRSTHYATTAFISLYLCARFLWSFRLSLYRMKVLNVMS
jgi:hypothetical protein